MKESTIPFALGALLAVFGAITALAVENRTVEHAKASGHDGGAVRAYAVWAADAAQIATVVAAPVFTSLTFVQNTTQGIGLLYAVAVVVGLAAFRKILFAEPDVYSRQKRFGITLVPALGFALNAVFAAVAQFVV